MWGSPPDINHTGRFAVDRELVYIVVVPVGSFWHRLELLLAPLGGPLGLFLAPFGAPWPPLGRLGLPWASSLGLP